MNNITILILLFGLFVGVTIIIIYILTKSVVRYSCVDNKCVKLNPDMIV